MSFNSLNEKGPLQPAAAKAGAAQTGAHIRTATHQFPEKFGAMVFDHHQYDALIESEFSRRNPRAAVSACKARVKSARVLVCGQHLGIAPAHIARGIESDLGRKRERRH